MCKHSCVWTSVGNTQTCAAFRYTFAGLLECASVILPADAEYQQAGSLDSLVALHYIWVYAGQRLLLQATGNSTC